MLAFVGGEDLFKVRRASLLLPLPDEPNVSSERQMGRAERIERSKLCKDGGLVVGKYGKGTYVYTGFSFFRQLPAGVKGAYRLFANLVSVEN